MSTLLSTLALWHVIVSHTDAVQEWTVNIDSSHTQHFEFWFNRCVGSGHASLALRQDWQQTMKYVHDELGITSVRMHGIFDDDVGTVNAVNDYSFVNVDKIYDFLVSIEMKPYIELSFMPAAFASYDCTIMHYNANVTPPRNYTVWSDFIQQFVSHLVDRYGIDVVQNWKFEVWNEPNDKFFEQGADCTGSTLDDYLKLYTNTANAIKSVSDKLKVGGPSTNNPGTWMTAFLNATITQNIPLDFVATHSYPSSAQNDSKWWYKSLDSVNAEINQFEVYGHIQVDLSEFNSGLYQSSQQYDNHDSVYASSFMVYMMQQVQPLMIVNDANKHYEWLSYWTFSDIFEEGGFQSAPFWLNKTEKNKYFGMITARGINKPVFNAMRLVYQYGSNVSYSTQLTGGDNSTNIMVYCLKNNMEANRYSVFVANFANYGSLIYNETLTINVEQTVDTNLKQPVSASILRIDAENTNPLGAWEQMGKPVYPSMEQFQKLNESAQVVPKKIGWKLVSSNTVQFDIMIPEYGVAVLDVTY